MNRFNSAFTRLMPAALYHKLRAITGTDSPPRPGRVRLGDLNRVKPISTHWGFDRGLPVDRYYIERFLAKHSRDIKGHTLEFGDSTYSCRFGGSRVTRCDVFHAAPGDPNATIVGDICSAPQIPDNEFDCIICTQVLVVIYDVQSAIATMHRILKPGGVLILTVPAITKISRYDMDRWGDYWRFTSLSIERLLQERFVSEDLEITAEGNVLAATAFLYGLASQELAEDDLNARDPDFEVSIGVRARKSSLLPER